MTAGVGKAVNGTWLAGNTLASTVARSMISNAVTQGMGIATGLQDRFSWANVAAAGIGSAVGYAASDALGMRTADFARAGFAERLVKSTVSGLAAGAAAAIARGGRVTVQQVAVDAFGNALGESIAQTDWGEMGRQAMSYTLEEQAQDFARENNRFSSALASRASDLANLAAAQRYLSMYPTASNEGINVWLPESMPATGNGADVTPSDLMRFEKASYQQGDFNKLDITGKGDTMSALFLKNYGYAPMPAELVQYGTYNNLSNVNDVAINREIVSPSLEQLRNTPITEAQLQTFAADDASYAQARLAAQARAASPQGPMAMPGPIMATDYEAQANQLGRNAQIFANAAQWAYDQGNRQAGDTYQQLANDAYYAGQRASITALNMNAASQRALSITTPNFDPAPGWSYMGQNSARLPAGGTAQPDFVVLGGTSLPGSGSIALNVRDGTTYLAGGVTQSDPRSIGWKPGLVATAGWIFGSNSAEGTNNFLNGNGNQAYVSVPTPWKVNGFVAVTHAYGGGYALELGVASPGNLSAGVVPISHSKVIYSPK